MYDEIFTFSQALANLAYELDIGNVALISSSRRTVQTFLSEATALGIRVPHILELNSRLRSTLPVQVESFLAKVTGQTSADQRPAVAIIVEAGEAVAVADHLVTQEGLGSSRPFWLVGSLGLDLRNDKMAAWKKVFDGGLFVEPHMPELAEFKTYFITTLQVLLIYRQLT